MADPLSISASIAGLVNLADVVFSRTYQYVKAVRDAPKDIAKLSTEIGALYGILSSLRLISDQLQHGTMEATMRVQHIHSCHQTLERVKSILERDDSSSLQRCGLQAVKRRLRWPFTSSEVEEILIEIGRHKATLSLALNADGMSSLLRALSTQDEINETVKGISNDLRLRREADTRILVNQKRQEVLDSFGSIDPCMNLEMGRKLRHTDTGLWLIASPEFQLWLDTKNASLWLYGIPGAGKTVLASLVIDEVLAKSSPSVAVAYFYCDYKDPATQEPYKILSCLAQQIAKQDEQSFAKMHEFYRTHSRGRKHSIEYDPQELCNLVIEMSSDYECTMIVIDGLDECGSNAGFASELLASLKSEAGNADIKTLFLSRDEIDIRESLKDYPSVSIAARSSDLRLYVDAEIETRTRKRKLIIKTPGLKEHVRDKLVEGAQGMFRWVTCQIDYLCELPNDATRRKALKDLPSGLKPTYERLLRRVNDSNRETKKFVQKALRWIAHDPPLTVSELCEAISINLGDTYRDIEAIPDESQIYRSCSSLVRRSVDGDRIEFAHFSVEEFLNQLDDTKNGEFAAFRIRSFHASTELGKDWLTYLNYEDFNHAGDASKEVTSARFKQYPFRRYAVVNLYQLAEPCDWKDMELLSLAKQLFSPSKPGTLISWAQDLLQYSLLESPAEEVLTKLNSGVAQATALHYAAAIHFSDICGWLIEGGCDVNRRSGYGTPLHCALLSTEAFVKCFFKDYGSIQLVHRSESQSVKVVNLLLDAGADLNTPYISISGNISPLSILLNYGYSAYPDMVQRLVSNGAIVDNEIIGLISGFRKEGLTSEADKMVLRDATEIHLDEKTRALALQCALEFDLQISSKFLPSGSCSYGDGSFANSHSEESLRTAARFGQIDACTKLLDDHHVDVDAMEDDTQLTALHYACMTDQPEVVQMLLKHGASPKKADLTGRTAIFHCVTSGGCRCLLLLLQQDVDLAVRNKENMTILHLAALENNLEALKVLLVKMGSAFPGQIRPSKTMTLVSCASQAGSIEAITLLIDAGCDVSEKGINGCTALHYAAKSGSPPVVRFLISKGLDTRTITEDGSSAIHYAVLGNSTKLDEAVDILIQDGADPFKASQDGTTPVDLLIGDGSDSANDSVRETVLQKLASLPETYPGRQEGLARALSRICQLRPSHYSTWLLAALRLLLQNNVGIMCKVENGSTAFRALLDVWQHECSERYTPKRKKYVPYWDGQKSVPPFSTSTDMVLSALEHIAFQEIHDTCIDPELLKSAIEACNDELVYKLLDHAPDVDRFMNGECAVSFACSHGCSRAVLKKLLSQSKAPSDRAFGSELVRKACQPGRLDKTEILLELLEIGLDPNGPSTEGVTAIMCAASTGYSGSVELLLSYGSDVKAVDAANRNVAHYACCSGSFDVFSVLRDTDVGWNAWIKDVLLGDNLRRNFSILHFAASDPDERMLRYLLDEGLFEDVDCVNDHNETALFTASWYGKPRNVSLLLSKNADYTIMSSPVTFGCILSSIHIAALQGHVDVIEEFMKHGCNLEILNDKGLTCEMVAWKYGHAELAKLIRKHVDAQKIQGPDPDILKKAPQTPRKELEFLHVAIDIGDLDLCKQVVQDGVDFNAGYQDCNGCTPLLCSLYKERPDIAQHLALHGATPEGATCNIINPLGYSAFHHAAQRNYVEVLRILLERHRDQYHELVHPVHPVHLAISSKSPECVELLMTEAEMGLRRLNTSRPRTEAFAPSLANQRTSFSADDTRYPDILWDATPLQIAVAVNDTTIARYLLKSGCIVNAPDSSHNTPLHQAASQGATAMIELLLEFGANSQARDYSLRTPAMRAAKNANKDALEALVKAGLDLHAADYYGNTIFHHAARAGNAEALLYLMNKYTRLHPPHTKDGRTFLSLVFRDCRRRDLSALLNAAPDFGNYLEEEDNVLADAVQNPDITTWMMKMLLKRVPQDSLPKLLERNARYSGTPLYATCTIAVTSIQSALIDVLTSAGAELETEGGDHGTALMGACAAGRLSAVKSLVSKGAKVAYIKDGQTISALNAAKHFPEIIDWLLVGRYMDGPKLLTNGAL